MLLLFYLVQAKFPYNKFSGTMTFFKAEKFEHCLKNKKITRLAKDFLFNNYHQETILIFTNVKLFQYKFQDSLKIYINYETLMFKHNS